MEGKCVKWIQAPSSQGSSMLLLTPMDRQMPNTHVSMVFSFTTAPNEVQQLLEQGLSTALLHYAEFAGRLGENEEGKKCIHLNNGGVAFVTAELGTEMAPYLKEHGNDIDELLASSQSSLADKCGSVPLLIQLTRFRCGGITLGIERHHHVADGTGSAQFLLDWSTCTRTGSLPGGVPNVHNRSSMMPRQPPKPEFEHPEYSSITGVKAVPKNSVITICVHFTAERLAHLKADAGGSYSTFVTLSAYLWKGMTKLHNLNPETRIACCFPVDGRRLLSAGPDFLGNAVFRGMVLATSKEVLELPLQSLADMLHCSVKKALKVEHLQSVIDYLALKQELRADASLAGYASVEPHIFFTSWLRFPLYDIDFGFGNPTSFATQGMHAIGVMVLAPTSKKDGSVDVFFTESRDRAEALKSHFA